MAKSSASTPPTVTTYEEHYFNDMVGDLLQNAKNKEEKRGVYTKALMMCSTFNQLKYLHDKGADLSSDHAVNLLESLYRHLHEEYVEMTEFILKHGGEDLILNNISSFSNHHKPLRIAMCNYPKFASMLAKTKIDWANLDELIWKINKGNGHVGNYDYFNYKTIISSVASSTPRSAIYLLKSKYTFSTHPKKKRKELEEMAYNALQNISSKTYTANSPQKKPYLALLNFIIDELKKENINYNQKLDPAKLPSWLKLSSEGKWIIDAPKKQTSPKKIEDVIKKKNKSLKELKFLASKNIDILKVGSITNNSCLGWAVFYNNHVACKFLLESGADPNQMAPDGLFMPSEGDTILHSLCKKSSATLISLFIENGADIHARNNNGRTPIFSAVQRGNVEAIKKLIEKGANINDEDNYGNTPVFYTPRYAPETSIKLLELVAAHSADLFHRNKQGENFIEYTKKHNTKSLNKAYEDFLVAASSYELKENTNKTAKKTKRKL